MAGAFQALLQGITRGIVRQGAAVRDRQQGDGESQAVAVRGDPLSRRELKQASTPPCSQTMRQGPALRDGLSRQPLSSRLKAINRQQAPAIRQPNHRQAITQQQALSVHGATQPSFARLIPSQPMMGTAPLGSALEPVSTRHQ